MRTECSSVVDPRPLTEPGESGSASGTRTQQRHRDERDPEKERFTKEWQSFGAWFLLLDPRVNTLFETVSTVLTNTVDTALVSSSSHASGSTRRPRTALRQLGLREGILNRNSLHPTQENGISDSPAPPPAHTKGVDAVDIDACDLGQGDGGASALLPPHPIGERGSVDFANVDRPAAAVAGDVDIEAGHWSPPGLTEALPPGTRGPMSSFDIDVTRDGGC